VYFFKASEESGAFLLRYQCFLFLYNFTLFVFHCSVFASFHILIERLLDNIKIRTEKYTYSLLKHWGFETVTTACFEIFIEIKLIFVK